MPRNSYFSHFYGREIQNERKRSSKEWPPAEHLAGKPIDYWKYFDICIGNAQKPFFFLKDDPFCTNKYAGDLV